MVTERYPKVRSSTHSPAAGRLEAGPDEIRPLHVGET
jgi:hypothetical protein